MNERDLKRVLTEHVANVRLPDEAVRRIRMAVKEEKPVKRKMGLALAMMMLLMLLAGAAVAAEMGIFDFLSRKMGQEVLPEAVQTVQTNVAHGETAHISFDVKQAAYDGRSVSLLVEMRAKDGASFLLAEGCTPDDPYGALAYDTEAEMLADTRTIAAYAGENGYARFLSAGMNFDVPSDISCVEDWQDNVLTVMYSFNAEGDTLALPVTYAEFDVETGDFRDAQGEIILTAAAPLWEAESVQTFDLPEYGIRIEGLRVTGTVLQSYWEARYIITDAAKAEGFRWFDLLSAEGEALPRGVLGMGGSKMPADMDEERCWHGGFGATDAVPAQLMLRVRDVNGVLAPVQMIFDLR